MSLLLIERLGRRRLTVPPQWLCVVVLVLIGLLVSAAPWLIPACFPLFAFANARCTALAGVYPGEVLPPGSRGIGSGFATAVSRAGSRLGTFLFPWSMSDLRPGATMLVAVGVCLVSAATCQVLMPETARVARTVPRRFPVTYWSTTGRVAEPTARRGRPTSTGHSRAAPVRVRPSCRIDAKPG